MSNTSIIKVGSPEAVHVFHVTFNGKLHRFGTRSDISKVAFYNELRTRTLRAFGLDNARVHMLSSTVDTTHGHLLDFIFEDTTFPIRSHDDFIEYVVANKVNVATDAKGRRIFHFAVCGEVVPVNCNSAGSEDWVAACLDDEEEADDAPEGQAEEEADVTPAEGKEEADVTPAAEVKKETEVTPAEAKEEALLQTSGNSSAVESSESNTPAPDFDASAAYENYSKGYVKRGVVADEPTTIPSFDGQTDIKSEVRSMISSFVSNFNTYMATNMGDEFLLEWNGTHTKEKTPASTGHTASSGEASPSDTGVSSCTDSTPVQSSSLYHPHYRCDECYDTIRGLRHHCNTCGDYDLCAACFHVADHVASHQFTLVKELSSCKCPTQTLPDRIGALQLFSYRCDACDATITRGMRYHCKECDDFDLCEECAIHNEKSFDVHNKEHAFQAYETFPSGPGFKSFLRYDLVGSFASIPAQRSLVVPAEEPVASPPSNDPVAPITSAAPDTPILSPARHPAFCDLCNGTIIGARYKCLACPDFDLCAACFPMKNFVHRSHSFVRISDPIDYISHVSGPPEQHEVKCSMCSLHPRIKGTRYMCLFCEGGTHNLCADCEAAPSRERSNEHIFVKIEDSRTDVLGLIAQHFGAVVSTKLTTEGDAEDSIDQTNKAVTKEIEETKGAVSSAESSLHEEEAEEVDVLHTKTAAESSSAVEDAIPPVDQANAHSTSEIFEEIVAAPDVAATSDEARADSSPAQLDYDAQLICDVSYPDGSVVTHGTSFVKSWKLKNTGKLAWPVNTTLQGTQTDISDVLTEEVLPGDEHVFSANVETIGGHPQVIVYYALVLPGTEGELFGPQLWVNVSVDLDASVMSVPTMSDHSMESLEDEYAQINHNHEIDSLSRVSSGHTLSVSSTQDDGSFYDTDDYEMVRASD